MQAVVVYVWLVGGLFKVYRSRLRCLLYDILHILGVDRSIPRSLQR